MSVGEWSLWATAASIAFSGSTAVFGCAEPNAAPATEAAARAELLHFRERGRIDGSALLPEFAHHSIWSAIGASRSGKVYVAVSNHAQPGGNAAVYRFDPLSHEMKALGDLRATSQAVDNWMEGESQYKVHTFLQEHADGRIYFASDDHEPTPFLRGAHLYAIDTASDRLLDLSKSQAQLLTRKLEAKKNSGVAATQSGVMIEYFGIKGMGLHPQSPGHLYAMTYPEGHLFHYDLREEIPRIVGRSPAVGYAFYVSPKGDAYYGVATTPGDPNSPQTLLKYEVATGETHVVAEAVGKGEIGAIAPNADHSKVWLLFSASKDIYALDPARDRMRWLGPTCGTNHWRLYNLTLSRDGETLYIVSNNNDRAQVWSQGTRSGRCEMILEIGHLVGSRNLSFGGINVWDMEGSFYVPVWTHDAARPDAALLRVWPEG